MDIGKSESFHIMSNLVEKETNDYFSHQMSLSKSGSEA